MEEGWDLKIDPDVSDRLTMGMVENARHIGNWQWFGLNEKFVLSSVGENMMITFDDFDLNTWFYICVRISHVPFVGGGQVPQENERTTGLEL